MESKLFDAEDEGLITLDTWFNNPFIPIPEIENYRLPSSFLEIYQKSDGMSIQWEATNVEHAYGNTEFLEMEAVLSSWENSIYDTEDLEENEFLEFFHPFDEVSPEIMCGFMITPNATYESIYLNLAGETDTHYLDLDFDGYVTMLYESRAYKNWPLILLDIENNDLDSPLIRDFKSDMPKLFPDFDWDKYVTKYRSLQL
ncbi:MAG: hypothetical protein AAF934_05405 [Bacteroidota bacterium]